MDWIVSVEILRIVSLNLSTTLFKEGNLLDRNFDQAKPNQFWVTDITYIPIPGNMLYMCAVLDLCGKVVLAWKIGTNMSSSLVTDTIREALQQEKVTGGLALHSDQGSQYTSQAYFDLMQAYHVLYYSRSKKCSNTSEYVIMETVMRNEAFSDNRG